MQIKFLTQGTLILDAKRPIDKTLIIGDLHIGIEYEYSKKGITVPSQTQSLKKKIDKLIKENSVKHLVFLGDVRHNLPVPSKQEEKELPNFLDHFTKKVRVSVIKGNHDGKLEKIAPNDVRIYPASGFAIENIWLCHGTAWPLENNCLSLVMGHIHPAIEFFSSGFRMVEHVWIRSPVNISSATSKTKYKNLKEVIIAPAFNHLIGGFPFNSPDFKPRGPILEKICNLPEADAILLDGTHLGKIKDLISQTR